MLVVPPLAPLYILILDPGKASSSIMVNLRGDRGIIILHVFRVEIGIKCATKGR